MRADKAREISLEALGFSSGILIEIEQAAMRGEFRCFVPKRSVNTWEVEDLQTKGYRVFNCGIDYEVNWEE